MLKGFEAEIQRLAEQDPSGKGRFTRAHLEASVPEGSSEACIRADRVCAALLAAVATNPSLLEPVQKARQAVMARLLDDGVDPAVAAIVSLAADGIWMAELFGLHPLEPELRSAVLRRLHEMTK